MYLFILKLCLFDYLARIMQIQPVQIQCKWADNTVKTQTAGQGPAHTGDGV